MARRRLLDMRGNAPISITIRPGTHEESQERNGMKYQVVKANDRNGLARAVNKLLNQEWKLYGGLVVMPWEREDEWEECMISGYALWQAMTKD